MGFCSNDIEYLERYGLKINKKGLVLEIKRVNVEALIYLIKERKYKLIHYLINHRGFNKVLNETVYDMRYAGDISEEYWSSVCFYEGPLKAAIDNEDIKLTISLINYGAYYMSQQDNFFGYIMNEIDEELRDEFIDEIIENCSFNFGVREVIKSMEYEDIFIKMCKKNNDLIYMDYQFSNKDLDILNYAMIRRYKKIVKFLLDYGVPLRPVKLNSFQFIKRDLEDILEDVEGYKELVHVNERE